MIFKHKIKHLYGSILLSCLVLTMSCQKKQSKEGEETAGEQTDSVTSSEWLVLFDGSSTEGWRGFNQDTLQAGWVLEDSTLKAQGIGGDIGGDIIYGEQEFENFELYLEWKISEKGNSGIFYHVKEGEGYNAPYENGPEYQLLDDLGFDEPLKYSQKLASDYDMYPADSLKKEAKPAGEWNTTRIIYTPEQVEHWLNGVKVVSFVPGSEDWNDRKAASKWAEYPDYGRFKSGFIGLQDHGNIIWFKNIKVKPL